MPINALRNLVTPPRHPQHTGSAENWLAAASALEIDFPPDFKDYVAVYGTGTVGSTVTILNPMSVEWCGVASIPARYLTLEAVIASVRLDGEPWEAWLYSLTAALAACSDVQSGLALHPQTSTQLLPWPGRPGLFPWGLGDDGQALMWWTEGTPEKWPILLIDPREGAVAYSMEMTALLAGWLSGETVLPYLPPPRSAGKARRKEAP